MNVRLCAVLLGVALTSSCGGKSQPAPAPAPAGTAPEPVIGNDAEAPAADPGGAGQGGADFGGSDVASIACSGYVMLVERFLSCPQVDQAARDATRQGIVAMKQAWGDLSSMPPDVQRQTADACLQATDALRQGAVAMGCPI